LGKNITTGQPTWLYDDKEATSTDAEQSADDVSQGSLGDCYFLSALALSTRDALECAELIDDSMEEAGIYGVTFNVDGRWTVVWVDCYFPCFTSNNVHGSRPKPIYAVSKAHKEIWPMVVEKAFAKLHGSYQAIGEGGIVAAALEALTGGQ
jgi:calpain-15